MAEIVERERERERERELGYDFIRFFATLLIVIHHFRTTCKDLHIYLPDLVQKIISHSSTSFGPVGVAVFFILSGAVLVMSSSKQFSIREFYKKRFIRICIPQWIGFVGAFLVTYIINKKILHLDPVGAVISFLGLNYSSVFWKEVFDIRVVWLIGEWFTAVIILLYLIFPLLKRLFYNHRIITSIVITIMFLLNLEFKILSYANGWFSITNGLMCFWVGMLFEGYKQILSNKKVVIFSTLTAIVFYIINPEKIFSYTYLSCFIFSILLFIALYQVKYTNKFIRYICKYSYEIYLTHHRIYILLIPALLSPRSNDGQMLLAFIALTCIVFLVSEQLQKASSVVINFFKEKSGLLLK